MPARTSVPTATAFLAACAITAGVPRAAAEEPRRVELSWSAPPTCPSGPEVVAEVERLVRGSPPKELIVASAEIEDANPWRVRLVTKRGGRVGKREVEAETCAQLADATAIILALMIDPAAALRDKPEARPHREQPSPPGESRPAIEQPPVARPAPPSVAAPPRKRPATPLGGVLIVSVLGDVGALPGPAAGVGVGDGITFGKYRFTADFSFFPTRTGHLDARPTAGGHFTLLAAALGACRTMVEVWRARGALCLGAELDTMLATGFGVSAPSGGSTRWGALLAGTLVEVPIVRPVSAELRVGAAVPFARPSFYFDEIGTVYRPTVVGLRLALGVAAHF